MKQVDLLLAGAEHAELGLAHAARDGRKQLVAVVPQVDPLEAVAAALERLRDFAASGALAQDIEARWQDAWDEHRTFEAPNPYLKDANAKLKFVGTTSFGQKRQVAVPMVVNEYKDGKFSTLFVGTVD